MNYYYAVNGQQAGPVSEEDLRNMVAAGTVPADAPVWREGMADWQPFSVALGGAPAGQGPVECAVCHQTFPADETIRYGNVNVCAACKPTFVQGLREGAIAPGQMEFAGLGSRFVAMFIDGILMWIVNTATNLLVLGGMTVAPGTDPSAALARMSMAMLLNFGVDIAYQAIFLHWRGQTLGKMALGIRVVTPEGGSLSWGKAICRPMARYLSCAIILIGYLMAFWDDQRRTLHDRLVGTRVIKVNK